MLHLSCRKSNNAWLSQAKFIAACALHSATLLAANMLPISRYRSFDAPRQPVLSNDSSVSVTPTLDRSSGSTTSGAEENDDADGDDVDGDEGEEIEIRRLKRKPPT